MLLFNKFTSAIDKSLMSEVKERFDEVTLDANSIDRVPSRFLVVPIAEEMDAISAGADFDEKKGQFVVPEGVDLERFQRWFPQVPPDLISRKNKHLVTKSGRRIEGYKLAEDSAEGGDSLAMPLMYAALPLIAAFALLVAQFLGIFAGGFCLLAAVPYLISIAQSEGRGEAYKCGLLLLILPFYAATQVLSGQIVGLIGTASLVLAFFVIVYTLIGESLQATFVYGFGPRFVFALGLSMKLMAVLIAAFVLTMIGAAFGPLAFIFNALATSIIFGCASMYALHYSKMESAKRAIQLKINGDLNNVGTQGSEKYALQEQRIAQAERAIEDKSLRIAWGVARGVQSNKANPFAPDPDTVMMSSVADLKTGTKVFGETGAGKTESTILNMIEQVKVNNEVFDARQKAKQDIETTNKKGGEA